MNRLKLSVLFCVALLAVLLLCRATGGALSPLRFLFYPLIVYFSLHLGSRFLFLAGTGYAFLFGLLFSRHLPAGVSLASHGGELFTFSVAALACSYVAHTIHKDQECYDNAIATFHSLSDAIKHKNMNLQTALDALSEAHARLQEYDSKKTDFLANVSHELRTPLSSIRSYSEILLSYDDIDRETGKEFIKIINEESERLTDLVNELLDLIRIESGKVELHLSPVRPAELIEESTRLILPMATNKGLELVVAECRDLPVVQGDRNQLLQVLVNLLNNAVKFTAAGTITVGACQDGDGIRFAVTDTGEGIFPEEKELIFDEFYRIAGAPASRPKGSGLGLAISRKIVEYHGGRIWVDSAVGKGSTFFFSIPLAAAKTEHVADESTSLPGETSAALRPVLVLSEFMATRQVLRKKLEHLGYRTMGADTIERAVRIVGGMRPGLIICDIAENWNDFSELAKQTRSLNIQMILVSLFVVRNGADPRIVLRGYLSRPFDTYDITLKFASVFQPKDRILLVSADKDECRTLQVLLGAEGYNVQVFADPTTAVRACTVSLPAGVVIGSLGKTALDSIVTGIKDDPKTEHLPLFLIIDAPLDRHIRTLTASDGRPADNDGLYQLYGEIEKTYQRSIGEL